MAKPIGKTSSWEIYSGLKVRGPAVVRADGRGFHKILESRTKPYDLNFARSMAGAAARLFGESGLTPVMAFTFSDEISILLSETPFSGRVEKLDSVIPSFLSGALSLDLQRVVSMDARVIPLCPGEFVEYLGDRQDETWRNCVFSYGFYSLVAEGKSRAEAMGVLRGLKESEIHELLFDRGINLAKTPAWERRGIAIYRKGDEVIQLWDLPLFRSEEGRKLIEKISRPFIA
jgi:tRNA(His) guanylyltransferase